MKLGGIVLLAVLLALMFHTEAYSGSFTKKCQERQAECTTVIEKSGISVTCSYPPAGSTEQQPLPNMVIQYICDYEHRDSGTVLVCKGFIGVLPDVKKVFTDKEFTDTQTRCTSLCFPCPNGWK